MNVSKHTYTIYRGTITYLKIEVRRPEKRNSQEAGWALN